MSPVAALAAAVRMEVARLRTLRSTAVLLAAALLVGALGAAGFCALGARTDLGRSGLLEALTAGSAVGLSLTGVLAAVAGALASSSDHRHGAARAALVLVPRRGALLAARAVVVASWSAVLAGASLVAATAVVAAWPGEPLWGAAPRLAVLAVPLAGFVALVALHGLAGCALASLLRSAPLAVGLVVAWPLVLEPLLRLALPRAAWAEAVEGLLPAAAAVRLVALPPVASGAAGLVGPLAAGLALALAVGLVAAGAGARFVRRDA